MSRTGERWPRWRMRVFAALFLGAMLALHGPLSEAAQRNTWAACALLVAVGRCPVAWIPPPSPESALALSGESWAVLGLYEQAAGKPEHALVAYRRADALAPLNPVRRYQLGNLYEAVGQPETALAAWRAAGAASLFLVQASSAGEAGAAERLYRRAAAVDPVGGGYALGEFYWARGDQAAAAAAWRPAVAADASERPIRQLALCRVRLVEGDWDGAVAACRSAEAMAPTHSESYLLYFLTGVAELSAGRPNAAVRALEQASRLIPESVEALEWLVSAYVGAGESDRAADVCRSLLRRSPASTCPARVGASADR